MQGFDTIQRIVTPLRNPVRGVNCLRVAPLAAARRHSRVNGPAGTTRTPKRLKKIGKD